MSQGATVERHIVEPGWARAARALPSPPFVIARTLAMLRDDTFDPVHVKSVIETDPSLTARLLRYANSASIRRAGPRVNSIDRAIRALGSRNLFRLLTTVAASALRTRRVPGYGLEDYSLWRYSLRTAVAAEVVAEHVPEVEWSQAYTAGLLLDIGKVLLGPRLDEETDQVLGYLQEHPRESFDRAEATVLGVDHAEVGAFVAAEWGLPDSLVEAIRHHHQPSCARSHRELVYVCHVADFVALAAGTSSGIDGMNYMIDDGWRELVPLTDDQLYRKLMQVEERVQAVIEMLDPTGIGATDA